MYSEAQKREIAEMLAKEGLVEVMTSSLSEQVAYILADRGALMKKIQAQEDADSNGLNIKCTCKQRTSYENANKVRLLGDVCFCHLDFEAI